MLPDDYRALAAHGFDLAATLASEESVMIVLVPALAGALIVAGLIALVIGLRRGRGTPATQARRLRPLSPTGPEALLLGVLAGLIAGSSRAGCSRWSLVPIAFVGLPALLSLAQPRLASSGSKRWRSGLARSPAYSPLGSGLSRRWLRRCAPLRRLSRPK